MLAHNATAVVARNEAWSGFAATEPYECGWAREALLFVRALDAQAMPPGVLGRVQISPDGMRWLDSGETLELPHRPDGQSFVRIAGFGAWLRLAADLPDGASLRVLVTLQLKS